ncbi:ImmA/IrrE family metallo-endopeptidase [Clostridium cochlearium]|uniref:ImmA/IrrE family metallo-endopeptidase n=1 Tax=Clostridium cochlearium TaxID=1494 RepID=UPI003F6600A1
MVDVINNIVIGIIETYGTNDPYEILYEIGVTIVEVDKNHPMLLGKNSVFIDTLKMVFIRNDLNYNYKLFYLRHELGHILLHLDSKNMLLPNEYKFEKQADYFALKLSQIELDEIEMYEMTIEQIASCVEVPVRALKQLVNL